MRIGSGRAVGLVIVALAVAKVVDRAVPGAHVAVGLGLVASLVAIARAQGLTTALLRWPWSGLGGETLAMRTAHRFRRSIPPSLRFRRLPLPV
jgi:hypothetical protein